MNVRNFHNSRGETASTDGTRWWSGYTHDEVSISVNLLQPVSSLFPQDGSPCVSHETVSKARSAFISAIRGTAPSVTPSDENEKAILRKAWDDATAFASSNKILSAGAPVFDEGIHIVGTADAIVEDAERGGSYSYCYFPYGAKWGGETNALVRLLLNGFPIDASDDMHGCYTLAELARAVTAIVYRRETEWYKKYWLHMAF